MHFPRIVVYGSTKFGGLGVQHLYVESGCNKIQSMMCHINSNVGENVKNQFELDTIIEWTEHPQN
jgi:hypothetical protein